MHHLRFVLAVLLAGCLFVQTDPLGPGRGASLQGAPISVAGTDRRADPALGEVVPDHLHPDGHLARGQADEAILAGGIDLLGAAKTTADFALAAGVT